MSKSQKGGDQHQPLAELFPLTMVLYRGLPGVGKSTAAGEDSVAADDYFVGEDGVYAFDPAGLPAAHAQCQTRCRKALEVGQNVKVANTFTQRWEMSPYLDLAAELDAEVKVIDLFDGGFTDAVLAERNVHGVPQAAIAAMRARYEHTWEEGDPTPPWLR